MNYLTADEKSRLEGELAACITRRRALSDRIGQAREMGDLRENAEYHAAREDQGLNETRIREIEEKLAGAVVTDSAALPDDIVFIGATVRLRAEDDGEEELFRLVGEATGSMDTEYVEVTPQSPMGMALMKSRLGESIRVDLPRGEKRFLIVEIM